MTVHTQQCQDDSPFLLGRSDAPSSSVMNPFVPLPHEMLRLPLRRCASASSDSSPAAVFRETHQNHQTCRDRLQFVKKQYQKRLEIMRAAFDVRLNNAKASSLAGETEHVCCGKEEAETDDIMKAIQRDDLQEELRSLKMLLSRQEKEMDNLHRVIWTQETLLTRMRIELDKCQAHCQVPKSDRELNSERELKSLAAYRVSTVSKPVNRCEAKPNDILMEEQIRLFFEYVDRCGNASKRTVTSNGALPTATNARRRKILGKVKQKSVVPKNKPSPHLDIKSTVTPATAVATSLTSRGVSSTSVETADELLSRSSVDSCPSLRNEEPYVHLPPEPALLTVEEQEDAVAGHQNVTDATVLPQPKRLVRTLPSLKKQPHLELQRFDSPVIRMDESDVDMDLPFDMNQSVQRAEVKPFSICITAHTATRMNSTETGKTTELRSDSTKEVWQSVESIDSELKSARPFESLLMDKRMSEGDVTKLSTDVTACEENKRELSESSNHGVSIATHAGLTSKRRLVEPIKNFNFPNYTPILCESVRSDQSPEGNTSATLRSTSTQRTDSQTNSTFKRSRRSLSGAVTSPLSVSFPHVENQHPNMKPISLNKVSKNLADAVCPPVRVSANTVPPRVNMSIEPKPPGTQPGHHPGSQLGRRRRRALTVGCDMDFSSLPLGPLTM
eukprot:GILJ01014317.1.p1 GENE.GILJ01014317.1~~GILJ01014317.1.p1  ORF type:complete len:672 (+),score=94.41 GILJ01014317.1:202-2217(+)